MKPFVTSTVVRWSDLDANRHLANANFINFASFARIECLREMGIGMDRLGELQIGPAILRENISYFKEAHEGEKIYISVSIDGMSENAGIYSFTQDFYREDGTNLARLNLLGVWIDLNKRKMCVPPEDFILALNSILDQENFKTLSLDDIKSNPMKPKHVDSSFFS